MIYQGNNLQFIKNVVKLNGDNAKIFVDQGHLPTTALDAAKADLVIIYSVVASPFGTLSLIAVIIVLSLNSVYRKREWHAEKR